MMSTVEPRLSGMAILQKKKVSLKMGVSAAVTMDTGFCACADATLIHCCLSIKWVDKAWFILFDYPVYSGIWHGSGTKVSG